MGEPLVARYGCTRRPRAPGGPEKECGASRGRRGLAMWSLTAGMASPCCGPPPAAAATQEPRPWRRAPRAGAAWLCEERRGWTAAARALLRGGRGPASASLPTRQWQEASGLRHHPRSPEKGDWRATCSPAAASPGPTAVHLGAGQRSYAEPTLAPGHAETTDRSATQERGTRKTPSEARLKKDRALLRGNLLLSQGPRWRRAVTYTRSRESDRVRFAGVRSTGGGEGLPTNRVHQGLGAGREYRSACWGRRA